ncbi:HYR-like domain-containing protein, partial [Labilibaculum euxinus]|uniref:HYR-like domain-containing protein n=1 Tax=Labilibaculum euxinus TaxID=2686357 RepID=UPI0018CEEC46
KTVVWTYTDGSGNSTTQTQNVVINDTTDPVADAASLSDVTAQCEVTSLTAPTATDNCDGAITGTHSETFPITASKTVVWTYTDGSGNSTTQTQNVVINDTTDPVADAASLSDVTAQCEVTSLTAPTATDNCDGAITGTHSETFPITASKTVVWTYTDGSGNTSTQTQNVVINDTTDPVIPILSDVIGECTATAIVPTTTDNCAGVLTGTTSDPLTYNTQGTHVIVWTFDDGNGNSIVVNQNVIINDVTSPILTDLSDLNIIDCAEDESVIPQVKSFTGLDIQATRYSDNCTTSFTVQYRIQLPDSSFANAFGSAATGATSVSDPSGFEFPEGISTINFRVLDASGNISNVKSFTVTVNHKPIPSGIIY